MSFLCTLWFLVSIPADPPKIGNLYKVGQFGAGNHLSILKEGSTLFVATGVGFDTYDVSDPENPVPLATTDTCGSAFHLALSNNQLAVADSTGYSIWDVSNPASPTMVSSYQETSSKNIQRIAFMGDDLIIGPYLAIMDSDTQQPIADFALLVSDFELVGTDLYALSASGLHLFDVSDPANPQQRSFVDTPGRRLAVDGDRVYVEGTRFFVVDYTNPETPTLRAEIDGTTYNYDLLVYNNQVISANYPGMAVYDVSVETMPERTVTNLAMQWQGMIIESDIAFVAQGPNGLGIYDVQDLANPSALIPTTKTNTIHAMAQDGQTAYLLNDQAEILVTDVSDAQTPTLLETLALSSYGYDITYAAGHLYVAGFRRIEIKDLAGEATHIVQLETTHIPRNILAAEGHLFVAARDMLLVYDLQEPMNPRLLDEIALFTNIEPDLLVIDGMLIYSDDTDLTIYDLETRSQLATVGFNSTIFNLAAEGSLLAISDDSGTDIWDITDPSNITDVSTIWLESQVVGMHDGFVYTAGSFGDLRIYDLENPAQPQLMQTFCSSGSPSKLEFAGNRIYVPGRGPLQILGNGWNFSKAAGSWGQDGSVLGLIATLNDLETLPVP